MENNKIVKIKGKVVAVGDITSTTTNIIRISISKTDNKFSPSDISIPIDSNNLSAAGSLIGKNVILYIEKDTE